MKAVCRRGREDARVEEVPGSTRGGSRLIPAVALAALALSALVFAGCSPQQSERGPSDGGSRPPTSTEQSPSGEPSAPETAPGSSAATPPSAPATPAPSAKRDFVVVIDPGHQGRGNSKPEPIGPGAKETKPSVTTGASGVRSGTPESALTLQVALKTRELLEKRGFTVIMVRTTQNVDISNAQRAAVANRADADLFLRLHFDSAASATPRGISTLVPAKNAWTAPIVAPSTEAGRFVHRSLIAATGAKDNGVVSRGDLTGFNWSKVPTVLPEMGFISNPAEDTLLNSDPYQWKLALGLANGVEGYAESLGR